MDLQKAIQIYIKARNSLSSWIEFIKPWCENCDEWIIRIREEGVLWFKTKYCECHEECNMVNKAIQNIKKSWVSIKMMKRYSIESFKEEFFSSENAIKHLLEKEFENWIYIFWTHWTWKTYWALNIMYQLIWLGVEVFYISVPILFDSLRPNSSTEEKDLLKKCKEIQVLVLDDIWQEKSTEWTLERLYLLLEERRVNWRPTIFTSNLNIEGLNKNIPNKAIISRIKWESAEIQMDWRDKRVS